ncbi:hypothetical protein NCCP2145_08890 [Pseudarthrobacter sp. NCCP-2145]|nr:hypothetical protein NCCP2145_08890 [Pseudarthrobacter sp. NCCP-2145]
MAAAWDSTSLPLKKGRRTCPAFSSVLIAATAAAATSWSRCSGPQPSGRVPGSGDGEGVADAVVVRGVGVAKGADGADDDGAGPGAAVQDARATAAEAAAMKGRDV